MAGSMLVLTSYASRRVSASRARALLLALLARPRHAGRTQDDRNFAALEMIPAENMQLGEIRARPDAASTAPAAGPVKTLGDCSHDQVLHQGPVMHHLVITDADDVISHQLERGIVADVLRPLRPDMMRTVDLEHQAVPQERVDAMTENPGLDADRNPEPAEPRAQLGFQSCIRERNGLAEQPSSRGAQRQILQDLSLNLPLVERRFPRRERLFEGLALRDEREHVLDGIHEDLRRARDQGLGPVHPEASRFSAGAARCGRDMHGGVLLVDPDAQTTRLSDA